MPIESHIPSDEINIAGLSLEQPERPEAAFDVEKEVTKQDWHAMLGELRKNKNNNWGKPYIVLASNMKLLFPERESELGLDKAAEELVRDELMVNIRNRPGDPETLDLLVKAKQLFPKEIDSLLNLQEIVWTKIKTLVELTQQKASSDKFGELLKYYIEAKTLYPEKLASLNLNIDDIIVQAKSQVSGELDPQYFWALIKLNTSDGLADPLSTPERWQGIKKRLGGLRKNGLWGSFARVAAIGKILAAKEAEITSNGEWRIGQPQKTHPASQSTILPEIKKF